MIGGIVYVLYRWFQYDLSIRVFMLGLLLKIVGGLTLGIIYKLYYAGGDTWTYYESALVLSKSSWSEFWSLVFEPIDPALPIRAIYFTRFTAVLLFFTKADYWLVSIYYSLFSFACCAYFLVQLKHWKSSFFQLGVMAIFIFPTAILWSSGLIKESLAFGTLLWLVGGYMKLEKAPSYRLIILIIPIAILVWLKYYVLAAVLPLLVYHFLYQMMETEGWLKGIWTRTLVIVSVLLLPTYLFLIWLYPYFEIQKFISIVWESHQSILQKSSVDNAVTMFLPGHGVFTFLFNLPYYLMTGLFRPILFESNSLFGWFSSIENLVVLWLFLWKLKILKLKQLKVSSHGLALFSYVVLVCLFLSFTIPNLGALARFRVYFMPFFLFWILIDHPIVDKIAKVKFLRGLF